MKSEIESNIVYNNNKSIILTNRQTLYACLFYMPLQNREKGLLASKGVCPSFHMEQLDSQ